MHHVDTRRQAMMDPVGAVIMLGTLFGLIVVIFGVVVRYDPEARETRRDW